MSITVWIVLLGMAFVVVLASRLGPKRRGAPDLAALEEEEPSAPVDDERDDLDEDEEDEAAVVGTALADDLVERAPPEDASDPSAAPLLAALDVMPALAALDPALPFDPLPPSQPISTGEKNAWA